MKLNSEFRAHEVKPSQAATEKNLPEGFLFHLT